MSWVPIFLDVKVLRKAVLLIFNISNLNQTSLFINLYQQSPKIDHLCENVQQISLDIHRRSILHELF